MPVPSSILIVVRNFECDDCGSQFEITGNDSARSAAAIMLHLSP